MEAFLEKIANNVSKEDLPYLYNSCYIFPTKRAALYFSNFLETRHPEQNFILPETLTIQEFITQFSSLTIKDDWSILLDTYLLQTEITGIEQPFDKFIPWGKMILKDFDECDKYLVNADQLFSLLSTQKNIEDGFSISEETKKYIEQFILTTSSKEQHKKGTYKATFEKTWSQLGSIYKRLQEKLLKDQCAYEGMAYKEVLERLQIGKLKLPYQKIIFCGFNALTLCEEKIFETIEKEYETEFWWDADIHFMENKFHEAGNFLRFYKNKFSGKNNHWIFDSITPADKKINVIGISSAVGQTEFIAAELKQKTEEHTAVVLCDEYLLSPLLFSLDDTDHNITMGYAVPQSDVFLFTNILLSLYGNAKIQEDKTLYYHKDIKALADHIYLKHVMKSGEEFDKDIVFYTPYMPEETLQKYIPESFVTLPNGTSAILLKVCSILEDLKAGDSYFYPVRDAIVTQLKLLAQSLEEKGIQIQQHSLPFIAKQFLSALKVPFETKKDGNIQIMGFLETRILDFENLYILSLNDDNLPGTNKTNSFIPYNLRKGFGLPTFEQFDGINAYHFYRLLKRAKNIHLLYNNQIGDNSSEKSRFIRQIQHDYAESENTIDEYISSIREQPTVVYSSELLSVKKTPEMTAQLKQQRFSPSALKVYIHCPLQFYLNYVAGVKEPPRLGEGMDAAVFGKILHEVMELTYKPLIGRTLTPAEIMQLAQPEILRVKIEEVCNQPIYPKAITEGNNRLQLKIIEKIAEKILHNDATAAPLQVLNTESEVIWDKLHLEDGTLVTLKGTIDRVDKVNAHAVRIIDYKTGKIELPNIGMDTDADVDKFLDNLFTFKKTDYSAVFQGLLYALMYIRLHGHKEIYVGYHHAKKMKDGIAYLNQGQPIPIAFLGKFEERLSALITDIVYKDPCFTQSDNSKAYEYSVYADLLGMEL